MSTRVLTSKQLKRLMSLIEKPRVWTNTPSEAFATKGGNVAGWAWDRRTIETLVDQGLVEFRQEPGHTYYCGAKAAGPIVVTEKGRQAAETGRYAPVAVPKAPSLKPPGFVPNRSPFADLPRIVMVEGIHDGGEGAFCPHCGAEGRYIVHFTCEGGVQASAMRGCFKLWPKHQFAELAGKLLDKERQYAERSKKTGREWKLCSWDRDILDAIEGFARGQLSEREADQRIRDAQTRAKAYRQRRARVH